MSDRNDSAKRRAGGARRSGDAVVGAARTVDASTGGALDVSPDTVEPHTANASRVDVHTLDLSPPTTRADVGAAADEKEPSDRAASAADAARSGGSERAALDAEVLLVYDAQCPACDNYCRMVRIREDVGRLLIVDAREDSAVMREITARGLDIDEGMVLKLGDALYYGADAIHMLALIGSDAGWFNRLNYRLFRSRRVARTLYPVLKAGRALLLKLLGRTRINNLGIEGKERF